MGPRRLRRARLGTSQGSEKILGAQVDDYGSGYGLRLVIGTVNVQATWRQETPLAVVNRKSLKAHWATSQKDLLA